MLVWSYSAMAEALFHIECPPDVTVHCDDELWDLSIYGTAYVYGYGNPVPAGDPEWVEYNLNDCGTGTIVRTWVAYDYAGTAYSCSQTIHVTGLGSVGIYWPHDYTIHSCSPATDPDDLPPPYDYPQFEDNDCSQLMYNYDDQVFPLNPPACKKILRKWTVIDWCQYDPNDYHPQGIWHHTQIIKIAPEHPPVIECPPDMTVSAGGDCTGGHVTIPKATGSSDCGAGVIIKNHSPYAYSDGADASGFYPLGTTKVVFSADDGCGGKTTCHMYITVIDMKAPTPICYYGISIVLMEMPDGYYMDLRPDFFDKGSFDNCTPDHKLTFDVEPSRVDCSHLGETPVKVYVTDESGNSAHCNTVIHVYDNMGICPPTMGLISGSLVTNSGHMMEEVEVTLMDNDMHDMTDGHGQYNFDDVPFGAAYTVKPEVTSDDIDGVTTLDLIVLLKHILGVQRLQDPYQYLAADVDGSGIVSVNDLLLIQQMILQNIYEEPTQTSWKFVDAGYIFTDPHNPLAENIPDSYHIDAFSSDMLNLDFVGVKLGDISGDAMPPAGLAPDPDVVTRSGALQIAGLDRFVKTGEEFEVALHSDELAGIVAMQYALEVSPDAATIIEVVPGNMPSMSSGNFGLAKNSGVVSMAWYDLDALENTNYNIVNLKLRALRDVQVSDILSLAEGMMQPVAYHEDYAQRILDLTLSSAGPEVRPGIEGQELVVGQNYPNPFTGVTHIPVVVENTSDLKVTIYTVDGSVVYEQIQSLEAGAHDLRVDSDAIKAAHGILLCRLSTAHESATIRMVEIQ
jgi:hypothetical protein